MSKVVLTFSNGKEVAIPKDATIWTKTTKFNYTDSDFLKRLVEVFRSDIDEVCTIQASGYVYFFGSKSLCLVSEIPE